MVNKLYQQHKYLILLSKFVDATNLLNTNLLVTLYKNILWTTYYFLKLTPLTLIQLQYFRKSKALDDY